MTDDQSRSKTPTHECAIPSPHARRARRARARMRSPAPAPTRDAAGAPLRVIKGYSKFSATPKYLVYN